MIFNPLKLDGSFLIELEKKGDERGFFARYFCVKEFEEKGLMTHFVQINNSLSVHQGTLRGLHYQLPPLSEDKLVRCIRGKLFDIILDLRKESKTFGQWYGAELSADNRLMMYVPKGFAHGFITLENNTEVLYLVSQFYSQEKERGIRWDDPHFKIFWPTTPQFISEKDRYYPDFDPVYHLE